MNKLMAIAAAAVLSAGTALADGAITYSSSEDFDDVAFAVESAIEGKGLVIDSISHTGDMLERTRAATGSDVVLFTKADIYGFCSAKISREVMEADITNVRFCPYHIFVYTRPEAPDETVVGFNSFPEGPMKKVEALLDEIVKEALEIE